ncbi:DUF4870 domain-containing protein [Pelomonas sp. SE-A7]|uniref:DUF4870 domain-containing protein n=1 Tax=Pelomonas sp. SE-A7 TaxID=3054953 RepID=UPI00259D1418|nr:DUF4870 domain-containing protein [Pelomonas sp. SE-A7]MDM4768322.1 DUF4870 domain-containing protein [Pelomonas sp. SE-A7]
MNDVVSTNDSNDRTLAILAHIGGLLTTWVAPLVIYLIKKGEPGGGGFAADQAREALNFQLTVFIAYCVCWVLAFVLIGILLFWVVGLVNLVFCIVAAVKASSGVAYRYPFAFRLIK